MTQKGSGRRIWCRVCAPMAECRAPCSQAVGPKMVLSHEHSVLLQALLEAHFDPSGCTKEGDCGWCAANKAYLRGAGCPPWVSGVFACDLIQGNLNACWCVRLHLFGWGCAGFLGLSRQRTSCKAKPRGDSGKKPCYHAAPMLFFRSI